MSSSPPRLTDEQRRVVSMLKALLPNIPVSECRLVASTCSVRKMEPRQQLYRQGGRAHDAVLVLKGMLRASAQSAKGEHSLNVIRRGELCGESSLYALNAIRAASVHTVEASVLLTITPETLEQLTGTQFLAWLQSSLLRSTARRLRTNRLAIRKTWSATGQSKDSSSKDAAPAPARSSSWWDTLRSSLKELV